jgi:hypothetical protein
MSAYILSLVPSPRRGARWARLIDARYVWIRYPWHRDVG